MKSLQLSRTQHRVNATKTLSDIRTRNSRGQLACIKAVINAVGGWLLTEEMEGTHLG